MITMITAKEARELSEETTALFDIMLKQVESGIKQACARGDVKLKYHLTTSVSVARKISAVLVDNGFHCVVQTELGLLDQHVLDIGW